MRSKIICFVAACLLLFCSPSLFAEERVRGIYLTQSTLENTDYLNYLIHHAKRVGINTFVIDYERPSNRYAQNIKLVEENGLRYVARIIVFPEGGTREQVRSMAYLEKKYRLAAQAVEMGANEIQLDYIRYKASQPASPQNSRDIYEVIRWFKSRLSQVNIPLQIDVFGITSFGQSYHIGQDIKLLSQTVDAVCPMVYPSHYEPYESHSKRPYETVFTSLTSLQKQMEYVIPFKLYPYIEMYNFRYPHYEGGKLAYIYAQIKATEDAKTDGWYAWSAHNRYDNLFAVMESYPVK